MNTLLLAIAVAAFVVYVVFDVLYVLELRRASAAARSFIRNAETGLEPALEDFRAALGAVRKIADDAGAAVGNVRRLTEAVSVLETGLKQLSEYYKNDLAPAANANIAGVKAGVKTGVVTLVKALGKERGDRHEGRTHE